MSRNIFRHIPLEERMLVYSGIKEKKESVSDTVKKAVRPIITLAVIVFALIGGGLTFAFVAVNTHLTSSEGIIDRQADGFWEAGKSTAAVVNSGGSDSFFNGQNYCDLKRLKEKYPGTFLRILNLALNDKKELAQNNISVAIDSLNEKEGADFTCDEQFSRDINKRDFEVLADVVDQGDLFIFANTDEWNFFKMAVIKDADILKRVERETGIRSRILVAQLVSEQMRLFYSNRPAFKQAVAPLKVLASMSQFSWGVLGIKEETATAVEKNLKNETSVFYPGPEYENLLDFKTEDKNAERFKRITDYRNHYYAYLYAALYNKQVITQWLREGVDISKRPEILATLYNIGFKNSEPNDDPQTGGAEYIIDGKKYSFGRIAYNFYYSSELLDEFPQ
ncbi:MAG: hypothetical protein KBD47_00625 [Candidatus Pacebacteria bacterium]|nr:hypothetical protein [Candidatus Paceibacterota bacterium]